MIGYSFGTLAQAFLRSLVFLLASGEIGPGNIVAGQLRLGLVLVRWWWWCRRTFLASSSFECCLAVRSNHIGLVPWDVVVCL
jgi:hypothetical protein